MTSLPLLALLLFLPSEAVPRPVDVSYPGTCDASTAIAIDSDRFVTASDEDNLLRLYRRDAPGAPVVQDITESLALPNPKKEADIEGSAQLGDTLFLITSHGRNKDGEVKLNRYRFLALRLKGAAGTAQFERVGQPYSHLLEDMVEEESLKSFVLDPLTPEADPSRAPEERGATNIEGLCAWRENQLLVAFRNPVPDGEALLVPVLNPSQVVEGRKARFDKPIRLDLEGYGIRSIEHWRERGIYVIVGGPFDDEGSFRLYKWSGDPAQQPQRVEGVDLSDVSPEAIVAYPGRSELLLLSDDGGRTMGSKACKDLGNSQQEFRGRTIFLPESQGRGNDSSSRDVRTAPDLFRWLER